MKKNYQFQSTFYALKTVCEDKKITLKTYDKLTSAELKTSGNKKLSSAQSSCRLFCKGVPVRSKRLVDLNSRTISES